MRKPKIEISEILIESLKKNLHVIIYKCINNLNEKELLDAVEIDPFIISYVNNPSAELQMIARKNCRVLLQYIENPHRKK